MDKSAVRSSMLEERVAMYLQAIEYATAMNQQARRQELEKDIQTLMDLMEKVSVGQWVSVDTVPPPITVLSETGEQLVNPLEELSNRLADYHKALYYAEIEIGENRTQQIQTLQRGLQVIQKLKEKAQAGFPIRVDEIPPPVLIPAEDEFLTDPKSVITEHIAIHYRAMEVAAMEVAAMEVAAMEVAATGGNRNRQDALREGLKKLEHLLQRAEHNIPIYKKDLPRSPALGQKFRKQTEQYRTTVELLTKMSGLSARAAKLAGARGDTEMEKRLHHNAKILTQMLHDFEMGKPLDMSSCPYSLADIERLADQAGVPASQHLQDLELIRLRCCQYKLVAVKANKAGQRDLALQHMKVVKRLESMLQMAEKGEKDKIDITLVPLPPQEQQTLLGEEAIKTMAKAQTNGLTEGDHLEPHIEVHGVSLAEELSAFLSDSSSADDSSSQSESTSSFDSPIKSTSLLSQTRSPSRMSSSGFYPLYAVTHRAPLELGSSSLLEPRSSHETNSTNTALALDEKLRMVSRPPPPGVVPSRALKPLMSFETTARPPTSSVFQPQQQQQQQQQQYSQQQRLSPAKALNGYHGNGVILDPSQRINGSNQMQLQRNKVAGSSSEITCIEILKYERMQLEKEGTEDSRAIAQTLALQMEEEKQRLCVGGYEAWLAYLGQVEEDVTNINCDMKQAREGSREEQLASLIIKKELAERELAVMRKRLPELQML